MKSNQVSCETKTQEPVIGEYLPDGRIAVIPTSYDFMKQHNTFTFQNLYTEYSRFHVDENNTIIHLIFIPVIVMTI